VALPEQPLLSAVKVYLALRDELAADYRENVARPYVAAEHGIIEDVIHPEETRSRLVGAMRLLEHQ